MGSVNIRSCARGRRLPVDGAQLHHRDHQSVNTSGRVTSFSREHGGHRVQLDRGRERYWIPEPRMRRGRDLRVGIQRVDVLLLRDASTRHTIQVDMRDTRRSAASTGAICAAATP